MSTIRNIVNNPTLLHKVLAGISIFTLVMFSVILAPITMTFLLFSAPICLLTFFLYRVLSILYNFIKKKFKPKRQDNQEEVISYPSDSFFKKSIYWILSFLTSKYDSIFGQQHQRYQNTQIQMIKVEHAEKGENYEHQSQLLQIKEKLEKQENQLKKITHNLGQVKSKNILLEKQNDQLRTSLTEKYRIIQETTDKENIIIAKTQKLQRQYEILCQENQTIIKKNQQMLEAIKQNQNQQNQRVINLESLYQTKIDKSNQATCQEIKDSQQQSENYKDLQIQKQTEEQIQQQNEQQNENTMDNGNGKQKKKTKKNKRN